MDKNYLSEKPSSNERIAVLDFLRGIAILGILFINIESFSYPNPWSSWQFGFETEADRTIRFWLYYFAQGKFYTMLAILFGVGFLLFLEGAKKRKNIFSSTDLYVRRLSILFIIGVIHSYIIWDGDILHHYAICGLLILPLLTFGKRGLLIVILFLTFLLIFKSYQSYVERVKAYSEYNTAINTDFESRTPQQLEIIKKWEKRYSIKLPNEEVIPPPREKFWGGISEAVDKQDIHRGQFYFKSVVISSILLMTTGMFLWKEGIFSDYRRWKHYWLITCSLLTFGLAIGFLRYEHWTYSYHLPVLNIWKVISFPLSKESLGVGYILLLNGVFQSLPKKITVKERYISSIGKTALSNYILQSILLSIVFYGYGFGMFNHFSRTELVLIVPLIWISQIVLTSVWLKKFKQGPLEFIWRKMTYKSSKNTYASNNLEN